MATFKQFGGLDYYEKNNIVTTHIHIQQHIAYPGIQAKQIHDLFTKAMWIYRETRYYVLIVYTLLTDLFKVLLEEALVVVRDRLAPPVHQEKMDQALRLY